jgi:hypothetical protein
VLNNAGQTAFYGSLTDGSIGIWSEGFSGLSLVARSGVQAPGTPDGVILSFSTGLDPFHLDWPKLNDAGQTAFVGGLTGAGVTPTNNWGVWSNGAGTLELVARAGDQAPDVPSGMVFGVSNFSPLTTFVASLNDAGQITLWANLAGTGVVNNQTYGIWSGTPSSLTLVTRSGIQAPGMHSGVNSDRPFSAVAFNSAGQVAFMGRLTGSGVNSTNDVGFWTSGSGSLELVTRKGNHAAGTPSGVNYLLSSPWFPVLNDAGQIAFSSFLTGSGVNSTNDFGIWSDGSGELQLVARTGSQAPGTADGVSFFELNSPTLNSAGQTAFRAILTGAGVDFTNDRGIWATDRDGALQLVVRTGELLEVMPGEFRTPSDLDFVSMSGNGDSRQSGFNNFGQLVFWASFTDGSQGVFVSNVVAHVAGDFNEDGAVDAADYVVWRKSDGTQKSYEAWRANFGISLDRGIGLRANAFTVGATGSASASAASLSNEIPEPGCIALFIGIGPGLLIAKCCRRQSSY